MGCQGPSSSLEAGVVSTTKGLECYNSKAHTKEGNKEQKVKNKKAKDDRKSGSILTMAWSMKLMAR